MNSRTLNRLSEIASALKPKLQTGRSFHVTFILNKSKIMSIGVNNLNKTHPKTIKYNYPLKFYDGTIGFTSIHSELDAWLKFGEANLSSYEIVNIRINNNGFLDNSYPCSGCRSLFLQTGFKRFFYSKTDRTFGLLCEQNNL